MTAVIVILAIVIIVACIANIVVGNFHWPKKRQGSR